MKAIVIVHPGTPEVLQIREKPIPQVLAHQVLVKVMAAGINRPDVAQRKGKYPPPPGASPDIPGLEVSGVIEHCGNLVTRWKPGDKVCALLAGGGYAEYTNVNADHCLPIPSNWSFTEAASLPEVVFTVWHNVFQRGRLQPNERLLVHGGSGGIGITAIQLAGAYNARVFATAGSKEKCEACISLGAAKCINYRNEDFAEALKEEGADVILDMIGGDYIPKNVRLLRPDGRLVFINAMRGNHATLDIIDIMRRRLTITGSTLRSREDEFKAMLATEVEKNVWPFLESKKINPVIYKEFALSEASAAHKLMESSEHIGKIILVNS